MFPAAAMTFKRDRRVVRKWHAGDPIPDVDYELRNAPTQLVVWHYIDDWKRERQGNPPPRSDIALALGCTTQNIDIIIGRLEKRGFIELDEYAQPMIPWKRKRKRKLAATS